MPNMNRRAFLGGLLGSAAVMSGVAKNAWAQETEAYGGPSDSQWRQIYQSFVTNNPGDFVHPTLASENTAPVGARLVCVFDASSSVDNTEYGVQFRAAAAAVRSDDFKSAVLHYGGPQSLAISFVDFGTTVNIAIPWIDIRQGDDAKFELIAQEIENLGRRESGSTYQVKALFYTMMCMQYCPWDAPRGIVDFMTDGKDNDSSMNPKEALIRFAVEQLAREHNTTVNSLITVDPASADADLEAWVEANLITPPGLVGNNNRPVVPGFNKVVAFEQTDSDERAIVRFEERMVLAFKEKLIREVAEQNGVQGPMAPRLILP